jgi:hypothetical protein
MQHTIVRLLEELLAGDKTKDRRLQELEAQNMTLQADLVEVKTIVQVQWQVPAQVMLRRPVTLIDAFDGNRLPFHLEFINSFEALFAVFLVLFKDKGGFALDKIRRRLFVMFELSKQKQIDFSSPWSNAFWVLYSRVPYTRKSLLMRVVA